jgi:polysaccharide export outer membrane protein
VNFILAEGQPMKVYVGGEVGTPGSTTWRRHRRPAGGDPGRRLRAGRPTLAGGGDPPRPRGQGDDAHRQPGAGGQRPVRGDAAPLRRFDIVYVPRSTAAEVGLFMTQIFAAVPFASGFSYALADRLVRD